MLLDTGKFIGGIPIHTYFPLSPQFVNPEYPVLLLERGAHKSSVAESLAPFHPDPSQRIVVLRFSSSLPCLVLRVQTLLEFIGSQEGSEITWDLWTSRIVIASINLDLPWGGTCIWVSGCRLFFPHPTDNGIKVQDFSVRGCTKHLNGRVNEGLPEVAAPSSAMVRTPVHVGYIVLGAHSGHDSVVFLEVSALVQFCSPWI